VIPALNQKKGPQEYEYGDEAGEGENNGDEAEQITGDKIQLAQPLI